MFASNSGTPVNPKNCLDRVLRLAAEKAGIARIGHADPSVMRKLYMREVRAEQMKAVQLLSYASAARINPVGQ